MWSYSNHWNNRSNNRILKGKTSPKITKVGIIFIENTLSKSNLTKNRELLIRNKIKLRNKTRCSRSRILKI